MTFEYAPPKYVQLLQELRQRIDDGRYPVDSLLPGEHELRREFDVSRATVVKALEILRQEGWIEPQQGRGTFVRGRPSLAQTQRAQHGRTVLDREETVASGDLVHVGPIAAPVHVARLFDLAKNAQVFLRRWVLTYDDTPAELVSAWFPLELADGTELDSPDPLPEGIRAHLSERKGLRFDHLTETVTARHASAEEARLLQVSTDTPVLVMLVTARDAGEKVLQVVDVVLPGHQHELEDSYPLT